MNRNKTYRGSSDFLKTAEFLVTYFKFEVKGHPIETGNWNFTEPKRTFKKADMVFTI